MHVAQGQVQIYLDTDGEYKRLPKICSKPFFPIILTLDQKGIHWAFINRFGPFGVSSAGELSWPLHFSTIAIWRVTVCAFLLESLKIPG